jgi:hypothetical protein
MTFRYRLIGLTGSNGAGKGEAAAFLKDRGYSYFSLSDEIREELGCQGLEPTRDRLIRQGNELRARFGPDVLARWSWRKSGARPSSTASATRTRSLSAQPGGLDPGGVDAPVGTAPREGS